MRSTVKNGEKVFEWTEDGGGGGSPLDGRRVVAPARRKMTAMIRDRRRCVLPSKREVRMVCF